MIASDQTDLDHLSEEEITTVRGLRARGWAVCLFTPDEMGKATEEQVEDAMAEAGWLQIDWENQQ